MKNLHYAFSLKSISVIVVALIAVFTLALGVAVASADRGERVNVLIGFTQTPGASEHALVRAFGGDISHSYTIVPAVAASIPAAALRGLQRHPLVTVVEEDVKVYAIDYGTELGNTWGVGHIGAGAVHTDGATGTGVKVAVIDSGIDCSHPELTCAGGYDFVNDNPSLIDDNGHGTHVAGTIAAARNGVGVVGVAPEVELYALKVLGADGSGDFSDVIAALQWATENGIQVTNNSYGAGSDPGTTVRNAFNNAAASGMLHIGAAGNSGNVRGIGDNVGYPARYDSVVAVAATNKSDSRASFSSTGSTVEISAPGVDIVSTYPNGRYARMSGTSMASPHVAGVAALVMSVNPDLTAQEVRNILNSTAKPLGNANHYGNGLVQAITAVDAAEATLPTTEEPAPNEPPIASFTYSTSTDGMTVTFTDQSTNSDGNITDWAWTFGDGNSSITQNPVHTYSATGTYTVTLTVTDNGGATSSASQSVTVSSNESGGDDGTVTLPDPEITLKVISRKVRGQMFADLEWKGAGNENRIEVRRDGASLKNLDAGTISYTDPLGRGGGTYKYQVCEQSQPTNCSNEVVVSF
jgi:subtilisin